MALKYGGQNRLEARTSTGHFLTKPTIAPTTRLVAARGKAVVKVDRSDLTCKTAAFELSGAVQQVAAPSTQPSSLFLQAPRRTTSAANNNTNQRGAPAQLRSIVFVSSEAAPWSKTGGLGDVIGSLPAALAARGHRVMVVVPRYDEYEGVADTGVRARLLGADDAGFYHRRERGVDWVFVDHPSYRRPGGLYADAHGPYGDNQFRFALLCLAGCEAPLLLPLKQQHGKGPAAAAYGEDVTFVANDWHAALVPVYLAAKYRPHGVYRGARALLAIHNLKHQGVYAPGSYRELGLPAHWYGALEWQYPPHQRLGAYAEEGRSVNHLKAGIATADRLLTVSPGYSTEITTPLGGWGMEGLLASRQSVLTGIVNGIDVDEWDPATDRHLPVNYGAKDVAEGKAACKVALQRELGLPVGPDIPLLAFIGRADAQKGVDLILAAAPALLAKGVQLVCLGSGDAHLEAGLRWLEATYPSQARGWVGFNVPLSHRLTAAADILLMPSRFEPCGLNQLYAMRYGAAPVAHRTGGLRDTVIDFDPFAAPQAGTGWTFDRFDAHGLAHAAGLAVDTLRHHKADFVGVQRRGMARDSSWEGAAVEYERVFGWAHADAPYCG